MNKREAGFDPDFRGDTSQGLMQAGESQAEPRLWLLAAFLQVQMLWRALKLRLPGPDRARAAHRMVDHAIAGMDPGQAISCRSGCAHCCHLLVDATGDEIELLAELVAGGVDVDRGRLERQAGFDTLDRWGKLSRAERRCVFLGEDDRCRIYADRPSTCRGLMVTSPSEECRDLKGRSLRLLVHRVELAISAAFNLDNGKPRGLPSELLRKLPRKKVT